MDLFAIATRNHYRYSYHGVITTEDLWALTLEQLNELYVSIYEANVAKSSVSLSGSSNISEEITNKLEIIKFIYNEKVNEKNAQKAKAEALMKRRRLMEILHDKEEDDLRSKSIDEIRELIEKLDS